MIGDRDERNVGKQRSTNVKVPRLFQRSPIAQRAELLSDKTLPLKDGEERLKRRQRLLPPIVERQLGVQSHEAAHGSRRRTLDRMRSGLTVRLFIFHGH